MPTINRLALSAICTLFVACSGGKHASPTVPTLPPLPSPSQPVPTTELQGSMTIISIDNPFDCVLQALKRSDAQAETLRFTIEGSTAYVGSRHFGSQDLGGSITKSEAQYEYTAIATGYRWYGRDPPLPVKTGQCPEEYAEYVITYARFPVELIESTDRSISGRIDLVVTAVAYAESPVSAWVPFGETRVVGEIIRMR